MKQTRASAAPDPVSEMLIVDTFTKLIFGGEGEFDEREQAIVQALRLVDVNVALDNRREMGAYLRALGVREMIQLVSQVKERLLSGVPLSLLDTRSLANRPSLHSR